MRLISRLIGLASFVVLLAVSSIAGAVWLTWPHGDVTAAIPGLSAPVDITLDADGIPRVAAASERDAAAALGLLHARERLFQMDLMRRAALGELSEIAGPATLRIDRFQRTLGLRGRVEADLAALSPDTRGLLDAYASGVNAWIASHGRFSALEFVALGAPRPWTAADSLLWAKTMGLYLSGNWRQELARFQLAGKLTRAQIEALWPSQSAPSQDALLQTAAPLTRLAAAIPTFPEPFTLPASASNEWAVDGAHSATGKPLLAGDPHLAFGLPGTWYLARLEWPGSVRAGATAPGVPFLVIGHNGAIAWTFTSTGADVQDIFEEKPDGDGYATESGPRRFVTRQEIIHVRGAPDEMLTVRETRHGPVISDLGEGGGAILALSMANLTPGDGAADGLLALNRARSVAEAGAAAPRITSPVQNLLVADPNGIGFFVTGRVPLRRSGDGAFVARGDDGSQDWTGWAHGDLLPHLIAPASGRIVNANERVAAPDFPVQLGRDWPGDLRARRIRAMLDATPHPGTADFAAMQSDDLDLSAVDLLPRLRQIDPSLSGWDGSMDRNRPEPLLYTAWMKDFRDALLRHLGVRDSSAVAPWPDLVHAALLTDGTTLCSSDCETLLRASHETAIRRLAEHFGPDQSAWRWGDAHQATFAHPLLGRIPLLGALATARIAQNGSDSTVGRGGTAGDDFDSVHGAGFRGVYDLADLDSSLFMITPGQSGDIASPLSRNFVRTWRDGGTIMLKHAAPTLSAHIRLTP